MPHFIVTFRFHEGDEFPPKHEAVAERIHVIADAYEWHEIASFFSFRAAGTAESLCQDLCANSDFNPEMDIMVVIDLDHGTSATCGHLKYPALFARGLGLGHTR